MEDKLEVEMFNKDTYECIKERTTLEYASIKKRIMNI